MTPGSWSPSYHYHYHHQQQMQQQQWGLLQNNSTRIILLPLHVQCFHCSMTNDPSLVEIVGKGWWSKCYLILSHFLSPHMHKPLGVAFILATVILRDILGNAWERSSLSQDLYLVSPARLKLWNWKKQKLPDLDGHVLDMLETKKEWLGFLFQFLAVAREFPPFKNLQYGSSCHEAHTSSLPNTWKGG